LRARPKRCDAQAPGASSSPKGQVIVATSSTSSRARALFDALRDVGVAFVDLNHDDVRRVPLKTRFMSLPDLALPVAVLGRGSHRVDAEAQDAPLDRA
jgi:hypothetical protein